MVRKYSSGTLIRMRVIAEFVNANSETSKSIVNKTIYETTDSSGKLVFRQKGKVARELLEKLFDHHFFKGSLHAIWIAMNYDWDRFDSNIATSVEGSGEEITIKLKKKE